nr:transmembrane protein 71 isoform X2 [Castor canadensis]
MLESHPPTCIFPSFDFLDGDISFECCTIDPLTGCHCACRRSPRLLTNGYYIWTEDSFLCGGDGNISLNPSQTSVMYKENLVSTSKSWLDGSIFGDISSSPNEDIWLEGVRRLDTNHSDENRGDFDSPLPDDSKLAKTISESVEASFSGHILAQPPMKLSQDSSLQSSKRAPKHFRENILDHSKTSPLREASFQTVLLITCFIISACARWFTGGAVANVFTCALILTIVYIVRSLFHSLASYFKTTACAQFAKI